MSDKSKIEWCDASWNPLRGCSKVSEGCKNCYAIKTAHRFHKEGEAFAGLTEKTASGLNWTGKVMLVPDKLDEPLHWRKPKRVFVNSMSDLFHHDVPDKFIVDVLSVIAEASWHTFQVLTKRPQRALEILSSKTIANDVWLQTSKGLSDEKPVWPLPNLWLGVSVENQKAADERIPLLLQTPAAVRFLSCEPLLGEVDISRYMWPIHPHWPSPYNSPEEAKANGAKVEYKRQGLVSAGSHFVDWVIVGGESGHKARPMHPEWARSLRDQCQAACVPYFFKQHGEWTQVHELRCNEPGVKGKQWFNFDPDTAVCKIGKEAAGRMLDGREWNEFPRELMPE